MIGIHAPATGAGAPAPSFDQGKSKYFDFIGKTINGRQVKVEFLDDGYSGTRLDRPGLDALRDGAEAGQYDGHVVLLDRRCDDGNRL